MTEPELVARKAAELRLRVERIEGLVEDGLESFLAQVDRQELVSFNLIMAIQTLVDLGSLAIASQGWAVPETLSEVFDRLAERGVLDRELASRLGLAARMRNLLVHRYGTVKLDLVYLAATRHVRDLLLGCAAIVRHLGMGQG